jgi:nitronate monooxygenase
LGANKEVIDQVHNYGGSVYHDVTNIVHAEKAIKAGVDGLIAVTAGAGGHAGLMSPFALIPKV